MLILTIFNSYRDVLWSIYHSTTIINILNSYDNSDKIRTALRAFRCSRLILPTICEVGVVLSLGKTTHLVVPVQSQQAVLSANLDRPAVLNQGRFCISGDIWSCLETFWLSQLGAGGNVSSTREVLLNRKCLSSRHWVGPTLSKENRSREWLAILLMNGTIQENR